MATAGLIYAARQAGRHRVHRPKTKVNPVKAMRGFLKWLSYQLFLLGDRLGIHVLPKQFYTPIADYHWLRKNKSLWTGPTSLTGVHWDLDEQVKWLRELCVPYYGEVRGLHLFRRLTASGVGPGYGPLESQVLHCFIRSMCPQTIVEIGSGVSTACMLHAIQLNRQEGRPGTRVVCVEPYPKAGFSRLEGITHVRQLCQATPLSLFQELREGDMLFVDSSHAVKTGSDTLRIYLDVIPNLPPGVFIQIHDVTLPYLYHPDVLSNYLGWQETALLLALLIQNQRLSVLACESALHHERKHALAEILSDYRPLDQMEGLGSSPRLMDRNHFPSSIWLRTELASSSAP